MADQGTDETLLGLRRGKWCGLRHEATCVGLIRMNWLQIGSGSGSRMADNQIKGTVDEASRDVDNIGE